MKLYAYQKKHVSRLAEILRAKRGALDLSATGTGKTICALSVAKELSKPVAVVAPLATLPGWERTAKELDVKIQIVNYESLTRTKGFLTPQEIKIPKDALVIYDEVHKCKHITTQNAKNLLRISRAGYKILALSATIAHHAEHLRALNDALRFTFAQSFSGFMYECGYYYETSKWGSEWLPKPRALELTKKAIAPFSSLMTIEDAKEMFKENSISVEVVSTKEDVALAKLYTDAFRELRKKDNPEDHLVRMLRARQASEIAKCEYVAESVRELVDEGYSVAVFCNFNDTVERLYKDLDMFKPSGIFGGQSASVRENERRRFQENETPVILCNLASGGVGLDLHDLHGRPRYSIILPSWSATDLKQALGRIHRAGAKSPAIQKILYSDVPVERAIAESVRSKLHALDTLHDSETMGEQTK